MHSPPTSVTAGERRSAHLRVGAAATGVFLILLLLAATHRPAEASAALPAATPAATAQSSQSLPSDPQPHFRHDGDHGGFGGGGSDS